ncbi:MAG: DUF4440 domain-containing protein [Ignavibacteria bacterium]|nr:DUF4440 domain-containing protein [Ignavibacteria bacterium]
MQNDNLDRLILSLEKKLLDSEARDYSRILPDLLDDEFIEFGSSGTIYSKADIIRLLTSSPAQHGEFLNFTVTRLSDDTVLARYEYRKMGKDGIQSRSLRSSIWRRSPQGWCILFHQGTLLP